MSNDRRFLSHILELGVVLEREFVQAIRGTSHDRDGTLACHCGFLCHTMFSIIAWARLLGFLVRKPRALPFS